MSHPRRSVFLGLVAVTAGIALTASPACAFTIVESPLLYTGGASFIPTAELQGLTPGVSYNIFWDLNHGSPAGPESGVNFTPASPNATVAGSPISGADVQAWGFTPGGAYTATIEGGGFGGSPPSFDSGSADVAFTVTPEPGTWLILGLGLAGGAVVRRRRQAAAAPDDEPPPTA